MSSAVQTGVLCLAAASTAATSVALGFGPVATGVLVAVAAAALGLLWGGDMPWTAEPSGAGTGGDSGAQDEGLSLLADLPQAVILVDRGALVLFSNAAAEKLFGPVPSGKCTFVAMTSSSRCPWRRSNSPVTSSLAPLE